LDGVQAFVSLQNYSPLSIAAPGPVTFDTLVTYGGPFSEPSGPPYSSVTLPLTGYYASWFQATAYPQTSPAYFLTFQLQRNGSLAIQPPVDGYVGSSQTVVQQSVTFQGTAGDTVALTNVSPAVDLPSYAAFTDPATVGNNYGYAAAASSLAVDGYILVDTDVYYVYAFVAWTPGTSGMPQTTDLAVTDSASSTYSQLYANINSAGDLGVGMYRAVLVTTVASEQINVTASFGSSVFGCATMIVATSVLLVPQVPDGVVTTDVSLQSGKPQTVKYTTTQPNELVLSMVAASYVGNQDNSFNPDPTWPDFVGGYVLEWNGDNNLLFYVLDVTGDPAPDTSSFAMTLVIDSSSTSPILYAASCAIGRPANASLSVLYLGTGDV
jgi:hypothetical protein